MKNKDLERCFPFAVGQLRHERASQLHLHTSALAKGCGTTVDEALGLGGRLRFGGWC